MIYVTGDKHGSQEMYELTRRRRPVELGGDDMLIVAGDFGLFWRDTPTTQEAHWRRWVDEQKWTTLFIDGNHENFDILDRFPEEQKWGGSVGRAGEKIYHLKRGEIYEIEGMRILAFGGAQSIDRMHRVEGVEWWPREIPSYVEVQHCLDTISDHDNDVDYVITHTCPREVARWMEGKYGFGKRDDPVTQTLSHIASAVTYKQWLFGHWHVTMEFGKYRCLYHDYARLD